MSEAEERYRFVRELLAQLAPAPADIVELGAAPGEQAAELARAGYRVTAVDLGEASDAWGGQPAGTMAEILDAAGVQLVLWDLEHAPYPLDEGSCDIVLLTEVLEHLRDYPARALEEARRILRPDGLLVLTTPNAAYVRNRLRLALGRSVYTSMDDWLFGLPHARHAREYTAAELRRLVEHVGLTPKLVTGGHFFRRGGSRKVLDRTAKTIVDRIARRVPSVGPTLVVVAIKNEQRP